MISMDALCVLVVEGQCSTYVSIKSRGNIDGKDFRVYFGS